MRVESVDRRAALDSRRDAVTRRVFADSFPPFRTRSLPHRILANPATGSVTALPDGFSPLESTDAVTLMRAMTNWHCGVNEDISSFVDF